jgi:hypothetical protein
MVEGVGVNRGRVGSATRPGRHPEWLFVVGHSFVAAVPVATAPSVVGELAALAGASRVEMESIVSVLPIGGPEAVTSFVVVVPDPQSLSAADAHPDGVAQPDGVAVSVVIRGGIAADIYSVGGSRRFTDRDIRPWLLADFRSVVGVVIGSPLFTAVAPSDIRGGQLVGIGTSAGDSLFWSPTPPNRDEQVVEAQVVEAQMVEVPQTEVADVPEVVPASQVGPPSFPDDTILRPNARLEDTVISSGARFDDTVLRSGARFDDTVLRPSAAPAVGPSEPDPVPAAPPRPRYGFRVSGGEERRLDSIYYIGRRPVLPRIPTDRNPEVVQVESRTSAVSATHLEIRQVGDSVVVTDLGSTNGTVVRWPKGKKERLRGGQSIAVLPGTTVDIGDGNIIEILPVNGQ